ncbi:MAG: hypothetical protein ACLSHO_14085 [Dysosmobacter sp.]
MNKTANFQLTQWEKTDRIMMEDFNRDNAAIDAALKSNADGVAALQTALASCGNCKIVYGTYTGTGKYGRENPNKLTFNGDPLFVIIKGSIGSAPTLGIQAMRGWNTAYTGSADPSTVCHLTWGNILFLGTTVRAVVTNSIPVILSIPISRCLPLRNKTRPRTKVRGLVLNRKYLNS